MTPASNKPPFPIGTVVKVTKDKGEYKAILTDGTDVTDNFENYQLRHAVEERKALKLTDTTSGGYQWRKTSLSDFTPAPSIPDDLLGQPEDDHESIVKFLQTASAVKPSEYKMNDLSWRFAVRTVLRGKNMLITGPKGTGKTVLAFTLRDVLDRPFFNIPLGSSQDPRSTLIGNVHFKKDEGTYVSDTEFVRAIQTKHAIILLDEITRAHPDAWNILMTPLDYKQRFLRIDEDPNTPTIQVAEGVTFIMTANIGTQYTATRTLDAALLDRVVTIEVSYLDQEQELDLLKQRVKGVDESILTAIAACAVDIRDAAKNGDGKITDGLSTRATIEMAELVYDGFSFEDAASLVIYSQYSDAGGSDSERAAVKMIVQKHIPPVEPGKESPFNTDDDAGDDDNKVPW